MDIKDTPGWKAVMATGKAANFPPQMGYEAQFAHDRAIERHVHTAAEKLRNKPRRPKGARR